MRPSRGGGPSGGGDGPLPITIESGEFKALFDAAKDIDRKLYARMRAQLRKAAAPIVVDIRANIDQIPSSGRYRTGVRDKLKAGTRAAMLASSERTAGVRIVTSPRLLPPEKRPLAKAFNRHQGSFRHPVFPNPDQPRDSRTRGARLLRKLTGKDPGSWKWITQKGHPYFGEVVYAHRDQVVANMRTVLDDIRDQLNTGRRSQ